jgi:HEAT repeat protein
MEWASGPLDPVLALTTLGPNLRLLPEARRAEIGVRGLAHESPSIRRDAVLLLGTLGKPLAARLARQALKDEPDPALRRKLAALVKSSPNRAKPTRPRRAKRLRKHRRIKSARR